MSWLALARGTVRASDHAYRVVSLRWSQSVSASDRWPASSTFCAPVRCRRLWAGTDICRQGLWL